MSAMSAMKTTRFAGRNVVVTGASRGIGAGGGGRPCAGGANGAGGGPPGERHHPRYFVRQYVD
ncbi:MAG: hypothetical protein AMXMBFR46_08500 [Acidimicrobiia bacterium]